MSETVTTDQWQTLCNRQLERALAGDANAARWVAEHKPGVAGGNGMPSITYVTHEIESMNADELRAYIARRIAAGPAAEMVQQWRELLCIDCRRKLLARLDGDA